MNVGFVNKYSGLGGGEVALLLHAMDVKRRGGVPYVALRCRGPLGRQLRDSGIRYTTWPAGNALEAISYRGSMAVGQAWTAVHCLLRRVRAIWVYTLEDLIHGVRIFRKTGRRVLFRSQGEASAMISADSSAAGPVRAALAACDRIACTTLYEKRELIGRFSLSEDQVGYVPLGIDCTRFAPGAKPASDAVQIGVFGRLIPWKGQELLVRALAGLRTRTGWRLMIVGDASFGQRDYEASLRRLAGELGVAGRIDWLGFRDDVPDLMRQCDVVVHCPRREPFGLVVAEAMACGACVVASDAKGPAEIIEPGKTGLLVPAGDVDALRNALARAIDDPDLRRTLGVQARNAVCARFDAVGSMDALFEMTADARA